LELELAGLNTEGDSDDEDAVDGHGAPYSDAAVAAVTKPAVAALAPGT